MESGFITTLLFLKVENMQEESKLLFNIINNLIKKNLKNISYDRTGMVTQVLDNDYLMVSIDKHNFKIKNGTNISFNVGSRCLVHYINGDSFNKIVIAKM